MTWLRKLLCKFGRHKRLDVIQTLGAAQHIGCPDCGKRFGIHHGERVIIPWDSDLAQMYRAFGHDVDAPLAKWEKYHAALAATEGEKT